MFIPHIPTAEITQFLLGLRKNGPFLRIGRLFMLSLVALAAIGHAGEWVDGLQPDMPGCTLPAWGCYQGGPLTLPQFIAQLGGHRFLLLLPLIDLASALVLWLKCTRAYLLLMLFGAASFLLQMLGLDPVPYTNVLMGSGALLSQVAVALLTLLSLPLAIVEQGTPRSLMNLEQNLSEDMRQQ